MGPWGLSAGGLASWMFPIGAVVPTAVWWYTFRAFEAKPTHATCRRFFLGSLSYLLAMLGLFTAFARPQKAIVDGEEGEARTSDECGGPLCQIIPPRSTVGSSVMDCMTSSSKSEACTTATLWAHLALVLASFQTGTYSDEKEPIRIPKTQRQSPSELIE